MRELECVCRNPMYKYEGFVPEELRWKLLRHHEHQQQGVAVALAPKQVDHFAAIPVPAERGRDGSDVVPLAGLT